MFGWEEERNSFNFRFILFLSIVSNPNINNVRIFSLCRKVDSFRPCEDFRTVPAASKMTVLDKITC